jgi:LysM repeat protein
MKQKNVILLLLPFLFLLACTAAPAPVEVTRLVNQEVAVEVTRVVTEVSTVEVLVEVTRVVEVEVTPTTAPAVETAVPPTPMSNIYTVQSGDNLSFIAAKTGVAAAEILAANNLTTDSLLNVGQSLVIPGWSGEIVAEIQLPVDAPAPPAATSVPTEMVPVGGNLLPNPSFEEGWYFFQGVSEWQIPNGWLMAVDESANTLAGGNGGNFLRPEIRVVPKSDIPAREQDQFVFDGQNTIKAFKGGAPTSFAIFTDVSLPPGAYRLTVNFFPDIVSIYDSGIKVWANQALSSEARIIVNSGGTEWSVPVPGNKSTLSYDFTVDDESTVRVGAAFRSRFINGNNGWFLDNWSLQSLGIP